MIRKPVVAGTFYPSSVDELERTISELMGRAKVDAAGLSGAVSFVAPHAGYAYSGATAAHTFKAMLESHRRRKFDAVVVIGPNHTGYGKPISVSLRDWETPFGTVRNDTELSEAIIDRSEYICEDEDAHSYEHSVEVELPFIQRALGDVRCVFICMGDQSRDACALLSDAVRGAARGMGRRIAVLASSDFDHYEPAAVAKEKDMRAIRAIEKLDVYGFEEALSKSRDTACGHGPVSVAALFAKGEGAKAGHLLKYSNSGEATKEYESVVAYASIAFA
jgi:MEMO1 family protein